jgi:hypothetical protein
MFPAFLIQILVVRPAQSGLSDPCFPCVPIDGCA